MHETSLAPGPAVSASWAPTQADSKKRKKEGIYLSTKHIVVRSIHSRRCAKTNLRLYHLVLSDTSPRPFNKHHVDGNPQPHHVRAQNFVHILSRRAVICHALTIGPSSVFRRLFDIASIRKQAFTASALSILVGHKTLHHLLSRPLSKPFTTQSRLFKPESKSCTTCSSPVARFMLRPLLFCTR